MVYILQSIILSAGTLFAWFTVYTDFSRFYNLYGDITRISGCTIPNPVTTPCFYGAFAFLFAFIWSIYILRITKEKQIIQQKRLSILLIASTIFAWSNLSLEIIHFYTGKTGTQVSCSGVPATSIFTTPCFIGSMLFMGALITSLIIIRNNRVIKSG